MRDEDSLKASSPMDEVLNSSQHVIQDGVIHGEVEQSDNRSNLVLNATVDHPDKDKTASSANSTWNAVKINLAKLAPVLAFAREVLDTPPPALPLAHACPSMDVLPEKLVVDAPDPCRSRFGSDGNWTETGSDQNATRMRFSLSCSSWAGSFAPVTTYSLPSGELFGTSRRASSILGNSVVIRDCMGYRTHTIEEQIDRVPGEVDEQSCSEYRSCSGTVYLQYIIRDWQGSLVAQTPKLRLAHYSFVVQDGLGKPIAEVTRLGRWSPHTSECGLQRQFSIRFIGTKEGGSTSSAKFPVAKLVTMMASWEANRQPSGVVAPSACDFKKTGLVITAAGLSALLGLLALSCFYMALIPLQNQLYDFEQRVCPKRSNADRHGSLAKLSYARHF